MDYGFKERLRGATPEELIAILNRESRNSGWGTARGFFLSALREAFLESGLDCSSFITGNNMRLISAKLEGNKVVAIAGPASTPSADPQAPQYGHRDDQSLVDDVIQSLTEKHVQLPEALGHELAQRAIGDYDEAGILRPFYELEDEVDLVIRLLRPAAQRVKELETGAALTALERERFVNAVGEECFQADGTNNGWGVFGIVSSSLKQGFVAVITSGGSIEGVEREFVGVFESPGEARAALQKRGYLDSDDFRQRFRGRRYAVEDAPVSYSNFEDTPDNQLWGKCDPSVARAPYPGSVRVIRSSSKPDRDDASKTGARAKKKRKDTSHSND